MSLWGLFPKEAVGVDKRGEQTPAGGIDLGGRPTVSEEKLPFVQPEQRAEWGELFKPSHPTHYNTSLGPLPCDSLKGGIPFSTPERW